MCDERITPSFYFVFVEGERVPLKFWIRSDGSFGERTHAIAYFPLPLSIPLLFHLSTFPPFHFSHFFFLFNTHHG